MADPKRPYKAYAAVVVTTINSLLASSTVELGPWTSALLVALLAGLAVYVVPNPEKVE